MLSLHGLIDIDAVARIDSKHGGIRTTMTGLPDAPITRVVLDMRGGQKGLIVNSTNICRGRHRASVRALGQNNKGLTRRPVVSSRPAGATGRTGTTATPTSGRPRGKASGPGAALCADSRVRGIVRARKRVAAVAGESRPRS